MAPNMLEPRSSHIFPDINRAGFWEKDLLFHLALLIKSFQKNHSTAVAVATQGLGFFCVGITSFVCWLWVYNPLPWVSSELDPTGSVQIKSCLAGVFPVPRGWLMFVLSSGEDCWSTKVGKEGS